MSEDLRTALRESVDLEELRAAATRAEEQGQPGPVVDAMRRAVELAELAAAGDVRAFAGYLDVLESVLIATHEDGLERQGALAGLTLLRLDVGRFVTDRGDRAALGLAYAGVA